MSKQPFLPMFVGDFLAATVEWEGEERALYALLLMNQWAVGSLPADTKKLAKMIGYAQKNFDAAWPTVSSKFVEQDGRLFNGRLEQHRARANEITDKRAKAGAKGGEATQAKLKQVLEQTPSKNQANAQANGKADARNLLSHPNQSIPSYPETVVTLTPDLDALRTQERAARASEFAEIQKNYPPRSGGQRWRDAEHAYNARRAERYTHEEILAGVRRYAAYIRNKGDEGTEFVQQAATFLGKNLGFKQLWDAPPTKSQQRQDRNIAVGQQWLSEQENTDET